MSDGALVGIWDAVQYGPGSMSDEKLVFLADGRGFWRFSNAGEAYVEAFRWVTSEDGTLRISGTTGYLVEYTEEGRVTEEPGRLHVEGLRVRIAWEDTPGGSRLEVLTLDEGRDQWRRALLDNFGVLSSEFRRRPKLRGYKPPGF
jgi:hypothetical protein